MLKPFLLALALLLPAGTQAEPARTISELLNASGVDVSYGRLGDVMANGAGTVGLSIDATSAWRRAALAAFDGGLVIDQLVRALQARHTMEDFSAAASFFDSALGRRVTLAENAAQKITDDAMVKAEGGAILARLMQEDPARLALYRRMVEDSGLLESALASTMSMNLAMVTGMQASGLLPYSMLNDQRGAIATELERSIYIQAAFTYAEISDADMQAYADFLTGPVGRDFYAALNIAISEVLNARARDFGEIFAELLQESAL